MAVISPAELLALIAERESLERERRCLVDGLRDRSTFDDVRVRVTDFSARLAAFANRLRAALEAPQP